MSHPPHGGCGLKSKDKLSDVKELGHPPHGGCGLKCVPAPWQWQGNSHPPHGGCGLKFFDRHWLFTPFRCHPPHGGCGLKYVCVRGGGGVRESSPTRGMWIEIHALRRATSAWCCHPPHGGCGLKFASDSATIQRQVSSPHVEIGLNCKIPRTVCCEFWKIPVADTRRAILRACRYRMVCMHRTQNDRCPPGIQRSFFTFSLTNLVRCAILWKIHHICKGAIP